MHVLTLNFAGYAECRLATDPDPTNETRGVSGYTFALPGEPDLDWTIRTQDPAINRACVERKVGVKVVGGYHGAVKICDGHPLFEARIELLDKPRYEERNYVITTQQFGVIFPFHFNVAGRGVSIRRDVDFYPGQPFDTPVNVIPQNVLQPYTSPSLNKLTDHELRELLGPSGNPSVYRQERLNSLQKYLLDHQLSEMEIAAIQKRISELKINDPRDRRTFQLTNKAPFSYLLNGRAEVCVHGQTKILNGTLDGNVWKYTEPARPLPPWPCDFTMGSWDADSLTFWMEGTVKIGDFGEIPNT